MAERPLSLEKSRHRRKCRRSRSRTLCPLQLCRIRRKQRCRKVCPHCIYVTLIGGRARPFAIPGIVEKCLSSARAGTKAKAIEAILLFVELDTPDPVLVPSLPLPTPTQGQTLTGGVV